MGLFRRMTLAALAIVLAGLGAEARAQGLERHIGELADMMTLGQDGAWTAADQGKWFTLTNTTEDGAVRFYWVEYGGLEGRDFSARANVFTRGSGGAQSEVGLIFNHRANDDYMALLIGSDGSVKVKLRKPDEVRYQPAEGIAARLDGTDILDLQVEGNDVVTRLNGDEVFTITIDPNGPSRRIGIIAEGMGTAAITGWQVQEIAGSSTPAPGPDLPDPNGGDGPPPLPNGGDGPPPLPNGGDGPPPLPGGDGPPPLPGGDGPPPLPGGDGPPPVPGGDGPPPVPPTNSRLDIDETMLQLGVTLGVFFHELAHAVIGETGLPATGPEEDVADSFSAFVMSGMVGEAPPQYRAETIKMAEASTLLWYYVAKALENRNIEHDWQDEHSPDIKRFRNTFCILFGSSPSTYAALADEVELDANTRGRCANEYTSKFEAWEELLETRGRNLGPDLPGRFPANEPGGKINLVFETPTSETGRMLEPLLKQQTVIPELLQYFEQYFVWPRDLTVTFKNCGETNAWYNPMDASVTMCYEVVEFFSNFVRQGRAGAL